MSCRNVSTRTRVDQSLKYKVWKAKSGEESIFEEALASKCLHSVYVVVHPVFHSVSTDTSQEV